MSNDWTPSESSAPSPHNERMANYKQPFNIAGCLTLIFMALVVIGAVVLVAGLFTCAIDTGCMTWLR